MGDNKTDIFKNWFVKMKLIVSQTSFVFTVYSKVKQLLTAYTFAFIIYHIHTCIYTLTVYIQPCVYIDIYIYNYVYIYRGVDKSLARPGRKQATATEDFDVHISYL
jgi:hypothetical protein